MIIKFSPRKGVFAQLQSGQEVSLQVTGDEDPKLCDQLARRFIDDLTHAHKVKIQNITIDNQVDENQIAADLHKSRDANDAVIPAEDKQLWNYLAVLKSIRTYLKVKS